MLWQFFEAYWNSFHVAVFDGVNRRIYIAPDTTLVDIEVQIYSAWKEWLAIADNTKYLQAIRSVGGDPLPGGDKLGATFFMLNDWKIVIDHGVSFIGNLYSEDGSSPFVTEIGQQLSTTQVSNLVNKIAPSEAVIQTVAMAVIEETGVTPDTLADAVWDEPRAEHATVGSFGEWVSLKLLSIKKFIGLQ